MLAQASREYGSAVVLVSMGYSPSRHETDKRIPCASMKDGLLLNMGICGFKHNARRYMAVKRLQARLVNLYSLQAPGL